MDQNSEQRKRLKTEFDEMKSKIDNIQTDVAEMKDILQSILCVLKSFGDQFIPSNLNDTQNNSLNSMNSMNSMNSLNTLNNINTITDLNGFNNVNNGDSFASLTPVTSVKLVPLYKGSATMVEEKALELAINAAKKAKLSRHCIFVSKIFTSVCSVRDVYRRYVLIFDLVLTRVQWWLIKKPFHRSRSGTAARIKTENYVEKKKFSRHLHEELIDASKVEDDFSIRPICNWSN